jgi:hypothetical protein
VPETRAESDGLRPDLVTYRSVVADLTRAVEALPTSPEIGAVEVLITQRIGDPRLQDVLGRSPDGAEESMAKLLGEVHRYRPNVRSSPGDISTLVRIYLLSQIDSLWWGAGTPFETDGDVTGSPDLVDLQSLRRRNLLRFRYRQQPNGLAGRARDWGRRKLMPARQPHTAGLRFTHARPELVALLNGLAADFAVKAPDATPPLWATSLTRSVAHQRHLRSLGYAAMIPSAHCFGYAADIEMRWFRNFGADEELAALLLQRQDEGICNVIDEGQAWHVCISPEACGDLRRAYDQLVNS